MKTELKRQASFFLLFISTAVAAGCVLQEPILNDLAEACLRGKVKKMQSRSYSKATSSAGGFAPDTASARISDRITEYNQAGNLLSVSTASKYRNYGTISEQVLFEYNGDKKTGAKISALKDTVTGRRTFNFLTPYSYAENSYSPSGVLVTTDTTILDARYRLKAVIAKYYKAPDSVGLYERTDYLYTDDNYLKQTINIDILSNTADTVFYRMLKADSRGNPIQILNIRNNRKDTGIYMRSYEYYQQ